MTTKKRHGGLKPEEAYPTSLTASDELWMEWLISGIERWREDNWYIVIPETKAHARVMEQIAHLIEEPEKPTMSDEEFSTLMEERVKLRKEKRFEEADAIRDKIEAAGRKVLDAKIGSV